MIYNTKIVSLILNIKNKANLNFKFERIFSDFSIVSLVFPLNFVFNSKKLFSDKHKALKMALIKVDDITEYINCGIL